MLFGKVSLASLTLRLCWFDSPAWNRRCVAIFTLRRVAFPIADSVAVNLFSPDDAVAPANLIELSVLTNFVARRRFAARRFDRPT